MSMDLMTDMVLCHCGQEWSLADTSTGGVGHSCSCVSPQPGDRQVLVLNNDSKMDDKLVDKPVDKPPNSMANNSGADTPMDLLMAAADTALDLTTGAQPDTTTGSQSLDKQVDNECYICLELMASETDAKEAVATIRELRCGHRFHEVCANMWLTNGRNTCPYCKQRVTDQLVDESNRSGNVEYGHYHHHDYDYHHDHFISDEVAQYMAVMEAYGTTDSSMVLEDSYDESADIEHMWNLFW